MYNLAGLAPGILKPLLKKELEQWSPLVDARGPLDLILKWAGLLASAQGATLAAVACGTQATLADPLHRILWEVWAPEIIKCVGYVTKINILTFYSIFLKGLFYILFRTANLTTFNA